MKSMIVLVPPASDGRARAQCQAPDIKALSIWVALCWAFPCHCLCQFYGLLKRRILPNWSENFSCIHGSLYQAQASLFSTTAEGGRSCWHATADGLWQIKRSVCGRTSDWVSCPDLRDYRIGELDGTWLPKTCIRRLMASGPLEWPLETL